MTEDQKNLDLKRLKLLIAEDKVSYVFEYLTKHLQDHETDLFNELILLYTEYNALQRKINAKVMGNEEANTTHNQLVSRILKLIDHLADVQSTVRNKNPDNHPTVMALGDYHRIKDETARVDSFVGKTIGNYRIGEYIAAGGFGRVHKAVNFMTDEEVAIKISKPLNVSDIYLNDMVSFGKKILKLPEHPNIVQTRFIGHDTLLDEDRIYYVMEFVEGGDLYQVVNRSFDEVSVGERLRIFREICEGIDFAHRLEFVNSFGNTEIGIIHGDIKPSNILLTKDLHAKVSDFLLVDFYLIMEEDEQVKYKVMERNPPTTIIGTKAYMAPEQMATGNITRKTDIFALGVLLFELLTSKKISFTASKKYIQAQIDKIDTNDKERISRVIQTCLAIKPEDRYPDVATLLAEFSPSSDPGNWFTKLFGK